MNALMRAMKRGGGSREMLAAACDDAGRLFIAPNTFQKGAYFTRPANVTGYVADDIISSGDGAGAVMTFPDVVDEIGQGGYITKASIITNNLGLTPRLRLYLFSATDEAALITAAAIPGDNVVWTPTITDYAAGSHIVATIDFPAMTDKDGLAMVEDNDIRMHFHTVAAASKNLFGVIKTLDAFNPLSGQAFAVLLGIEH
jgi:hypothetical protein